MRFSPVLLNYRTAGSYLTNGWHKNGVWVWSDDTLIEYLEWGTNQPGDYDPPSIVYARLYGAEPINMYQTGSSVTYFICEKIPGKYIMFYIQLVIFLFGIAYTHHIFSTGVEMGSVIIVYLFYIWKGDSKSPHSCRFGRRQTAAIGLWHVLGAYIYNIT